MLHSTTFPAEQIHDVCNTHNMRQFRQFKNLKMKPSLSRVETCSPTEPKSNYVSRLSRENDTSSVVVVETFPVTFQGYTYTGHLAYPRGETFRPLVLVFPNYAGEKEFDVDQAIFLAQMGYAAVSVDIYKDVEWYPRRVRNPSLESPHQDIVTHWKGAFRAYNSWQKNPRGWRDIMSLYLKKARQHRAVHPTHAAAIGYCFGGQCVLEMVRNGDVSFCFVFLA